MSKLLLAFGGGILVGRFGWSILSAAFGKLWHKLTAWSTKP